MTRCEALGADLSAFLDGEAAADAAARVREHLEACADCRETAALWRSFGDRLRAEDTTPLEFPTIQSAVAAEIARAQVGPLRASPAPPRGAPPAAFPARAPRGKLGFLAAAAVLVSAGGIVWVAFARGDEARRLADLEGRDRLAVVTQLNASEALRLEIATIRLKARAAGLSDDDLARLESDAKNLFDAARSIDARVGAVQSRLERGGLLAMDWPAAQGANRGVLR
jgi:anti-sigma factor RsiW